MALSQKEHKVLTLVALGYSDKEICLKLNIAYGTLRTYIDRTVYKLQARNRANAIIIYKLENKDWLEEYKTILRKENNEILQFYGI